MHPAARQTSARRRRAQDGSAVGAAQTPLPNFSYKVQRTR
jgi:hypothetical protein